MDNNKTANIQPHPPRFAGNAGKRPPVVVVMGHIDHGKSKLLDYIRKSNVVEGEAGGITQHIGAYEVEVNGEKITFLDTPGHEAFSKMRIRGAKIADIAILVIAADDGVKPQSIEAHKAIEQAGIPFIVALNKIDKPEANPEAVKGQLAENQIFVEGYGGKIPSANISAKTGEGVDGLLEMALLLAEMENLTASPQDNASGAVIESHLDPQRGISATLLIQNGTMKKGMFALSGSAIAPIRIFEDFKGSPLEEAAFSSPVKIVGFNKIPEVGTAFKTFNSKKEAEAARGKTLGVTAPDIALRSQGGREEGAEEKISIPVIIKADTSGSLEAVEKEIMKLEDEEISINILREGVGNISEDDLKSVSGAENPIVLAFNVGVDSNIRELAERFNITIQSSDIIYKISEWLEEEIKKLKLSLQKEKIIGKAEILKTFSKTKNKKLVGGRVLEGRLIEGRNIKIKRGDLEIGAGKIIELQHNKMRVKEAEEGKEFGVIIESKSEIAKGDTVEIIEKTG